MSNDLRLPTPVVTAYAGVPSAIDCSTTARARAIAASAAASMSTFAPPRATASTSSSVSPEPVRVTRRISCPIPSQSRSGPAGDGAASGAERRTLPRRRARSCRRAVGRRSRRSTRPETTEPTPSAIERAKVDRRLHATRFAAITGSTISAAIRRMPTIRIDTATVRAASTATTTLSARDRNSRDTTALFVEHRRDETAEENRDRREGGDPQHEAPSRGRRG